MVSKSVHDALDRALFLVPKEVKMTFVDQMTPDVCYVVTTQMKVKRSVTGYYVSHDDETLILLNEKGKFTNVAIENIIRINYYWEGRAPFERG